MSISPACMHYLLTYSTHSPRHHFQSFRAVTNNGTPLDQDEVTGEYFPHHEAKQPSGPHGPVFPPVDRRG